MRPAPPHRHSHGHAFSFLNARERDGLNVFSRRSVLKAGLAGLAGLSFPHLLRLRAETSAAIRSTPGNKAVLLLWMTSGPSHIDTWDVKRFGNCFNAGRPAASCWPIVRCRCS